jgi:hypothetical protein
VDLSASQLDKETSEPSRRSEVKKAEQDTANEALSSNEVEVTKSVK